MRYSTVATAPIAARHVHVRHTVVSRTHGTCTVRSDPSPGCVGTVPGPAFAARSINNGSPKRPPCKYLLYRRGLPLDARQAPGRHLQLSLVAAIWLATQPMQQLTVEHLLPVNLFTDNSSNLASHHCLVSAVVELYDGLHAIHRAVHAPVPVQAIGLSGRTTAQLS